MRGRIIHYNAADGRGLVAAENQQYPFEIAQWRSETAPAVNAVVEFEPVQERAIAVSRVSEEVLVREKAGELAGKLGALGSSALRGAQASPVADVAHGGMARLGKAVVGAYLLFAVAALFLPYVEFKNFMGSQSFTLSSLSDLGERIGLSLGGGALVWFAIASVFVPLLWHHRAAWLALLLPLVATLKPAWDAQRAASQLADASGGLVGAGFASAMAEEMAQMMSLGLGAYVCGLVGLVLSGVAALRFMRAPVITP